MQASLNRRRLVQFVFLCERRASNARMKNVEFGIMRLNNVNIGAAALPRVVVFPHHQPRAFAQKHKACAQRQGCPQRGIFEAPHLSNLNLLRGVLCVRSTVALFPLFCMSNDFPPRVVSTWQQVSKRANFLPKSCIQRSSIQGTWLAIFVMILSLLT